MRVLYLFSNSKWTGPAEPALNLCVSLRALGVDVEFACSPGPESKRNRIVETARDRGIEPLLDFHLLKHRRPWSNHRDRAALGKYLRQYSFDFVHCNLDNDHLLATRVCPPLGIPVIRSSHEGGGLDRKGLHRRLLRNTRFLIQPSARALEHDSREYGFPEERMAVVPGAVDTERFDPAREVPDGRRRLGIPRDAFVVGIVARMQTHREYEVLWGALEKLVAVNDSVHALVVGRGTKQDEVAHGPVRARGLESHVHFSGFVEGEDYVGMLKAFDVKVFLVPGSDGTCRAVREAMAMGKAAVVSDRGMLSEIVEHGKTGMVFDGSETALRETFAALIANKATARALGKAARQKTLVDYSLSAQAAAILNI
ncbi:MAG: glycosyltransferase family 4 protein, partial [Candidatus Hydrogenedentes bacterium]|nr:glycosyltransferase family 4 protein [Candidatus Hydrogenedentota bacterium]